VIKIVALAIEKFPQFASSVDMANESIVYKKYVHIGVAVDTPNGLLVPVIRDVDKKSISDIATELTTLSQKARDRKLSLDEMSGGVFSITNLGGIGGTFLYAHRQPAGSRDSRPVADGNRAGVEGRELRAAPDAAAVPLL
jgi:pyruvate/2-oxoglutarate dehydrogenase complex dihydrolipoamide acyltransferase (E2) component